MDNILSTNDVYKDKELEGLYIDLIEEFGDKDYSNEALEKILQKEIQVKPNKTQTEISRDRELCIQVLEQDIRLMDTAYQKLEDVKYTDALIKEINKKPEFEYQPFVKEPLPDKPERPHKSTKSVGEVYSNMDSVVDFFGEGAFGRFIGVILSLLVTVSLTLIFAQSTGYFFKKVYSLFDDIGNFLLVLLFGGLTVVSFFAVIFSFTNPYIFSTGLVAVVLFPIFLLSIIPIIIYNIIKAKQWTEEWDSLQWNYQCQKKRVEENNKQNYIYYQESRDNAHARFERRWQNAESDRNTKTEKLKEILLGQQKEMTVYSKILDYARKKIFTIPEEYDVKEKKEKIVFYLKTFRATTFTEAVNRIEEEAAREKALQSQEKYQQERLEIEKQKLEEEEEYNRQAALREKERLAMQREALEIQKRLQEEEKKRAEILEKAQKELSQHLSSIQEKLEEANAPSYDSSSVTARDIEEIARRYSN